ncbi:MAG: methyltransferase domain-containing protein [Halioglobus sp.]
MNKLDKQVDAAHYDFFRYVTKARWSSIWHQLEEVAGLLPDSVLEIGPGPGLFKKLAEIAGISVKTLDLDSELMPDYLGSAVDMPLISNSFDVVCAFQMLEHLPYKDSLASFKEMTRVSRRHVVISLPDARTLWRYHFRVPKLGGFDFFIPRPRIMSPIHEFDGEHYWEVNTRGYQLKKVLDDFSQFATLKKTFRVVDNTYHRFMIFEINGNTDQGIAELDDSD